MFSGLDIEITFPLWPILAFLFGFRMPWYIWLFLLFPSLGWSVWFFFLVGLLYTAVSTTYSVDELMHMAVIKNLLLANQKVQDKARKAAIITHLFDYIVDHAIPLAQRTPSLKQVIINKCYEFKRTSSHRVDLIASSNRLLAALDQPLEEPCAAQGEAFKCEKDMKRFAKKCGFELTPAVMPAYVNWESQLDPYIKPNRYEKMMLFINKHEHLFAPME